MTQLFPAAESGKMFIFCEPSCLSAVREDAPSLLRGEEQRKAAVVADACVSFEEFVESQISSGRLRLQFTPADGPVLLHGHCHQKSMGLLPVTKALLGRIPGAAVIDPDAGCRDGGVIRLQSRSLRCLETNRRATSVPGSPE